MCAFLIVDSFFFLFENRFHCLFSLQQKYKFVNNLCYLLQIVKWQGESPQSVAS